MKHTTKRWGRGALAFLLSASMMTGGVPAQAFAEVIPPQGEVEVEPAGNENTTPAPQNTTSPEIVVQESDEPASEPAITTQADDVNSSYAATDGDTNYAGIDDAITALFSNSEKRDVTLTLLKDVTMHEPKIMDLRNDSFVCSRYIDLNGHTITFRSDNDSDKYAMHVKDGHLGIMDCSKTGSSAGTGTIAGAGILVGAPYEGFYRQPSLTMDCGTIKDAKEYGVDVRTLGTFTMEDGTITGSKASGVRVVGHIQVDYDKYFTSSFTMNGGTITGSTQNGVSVGDGATFTQKGGTITGNKGTKNEEQLVGGNGVSVENATFTQEGGIVDQNAADGIHAGANSTITQGASGVIADNDRYGVFVDGGGNTTSSSVSIGGTVKGNALTGVYTMGYNNDYRVGTTIEGATIIDNGKGVPSPTKDDPDKVTLPEKGGGVYVGKFANLTLRGSTIAGNKAQNGAGVYVETINIEGTDYYTPITISGNKIGGGAVEKAEPAVEGQDDTDQAEETEETKKLTGNVATGNGGGVYINSLDADDAFTISGNTISGNEAANGAGVYVKTAGRENAKARTIANNNIGAPIKTSQESTEGQGTTGQTEGTEETEEPAGNIATGNGGGVYIESSDATDRLSVDGNTISGNEAANGAGVYVKGAKQNDLISTITLSENTIAQNTAQAPAPEGDATTQDDSQTTPTGGDGGGLYMDTFSVLLNDESSSDIKENKATDGAGVYVASGQISITATASVTKNEATGNGGGFYVAGSNESGQDIAEGAVIGEKATVTDNSAANGGGIFIASGTAKVMCNITGNTASEQGGGVHHASESGVFAVAGKANVTGNEIKAAKSEEIVTQSDEATEEKTFNNVFLGQGKTITVTGQLTEATIPGAIGVTAQATPTAEQDVQITTGYTTADNKTPFPHFFSDVKHKDVYVGWNKNTQGADDNTEAALKLHTHTAETPWSYEEKAVEGSKKNEKVVDAWCVSEESIAQDACSIHEDDPLTLKISAKDATYDGKEYNAEKSEVTVEATYQDKAFDAWGLEKGSEIGLSVPVVEYYQGETKLDAAPKDAGTYTAKAVITQKLQSSSTETRTFSATCDFTIAPAPLTVTAKDKTVNFGDAPANDGVNYDGLVGGETEAVLSGTLAYDYAGYKAGSPAGSYKITPSGLTSNNYVITFKPGTLTVNGPKEVTTTYSAHVQGIGDTDPVHNGAESGTTGSSKRVESIKASIENQPYAGDIEYRGHVQGIGWEASWAKNGELSGTTGQSKRVEAIQMRLTGDMGKNYDVFYRVHAQTFGWLGWAKNGEPAGTSAMSKRVEAYEVLVLKKGETPEGYDAASAAFVSTPAGRAHVQGLGWVGRTGTSFGTTGSSRRVEAFTLGLSGLPWDGKISYQSHVQGIGWQGTKSDGALSGTTGKSKRVEAVRISLSGEASEHLDVWYRVHSQTYGWLGWAKNGESAGTAGYSKRSEAVEVQLLPKGATPAGYDASKTAYRTK